MNLHFGQGPAGIFLFHVVSAGTAQGLGPGIIQSLVTHVSCGWLMLSVSWQLSMWPAWASSQQTGPKHK